jgi:hypothetical protein
MAGISGLRPQPLMNFLGSAAVPTASSCARKATRSERGPLSPRESISKLADKAVRTPAVQRAMSESLGNTTGVKHPLRLLIHEV